MSEGAGVRLAWVLHAGRLCPVSSFAGVPPEARPEVTCPLCGRAVVLRLGAQVAHHAAHRAGDDCAVTAPESALHLNCKLHLAACLEAAAGQGGLRLAEPCAAAALRPAGCLGTVERPWLPGGWARVAVELSLGGRRPDLTLLDVQGVPLAAIEVHVQSPVTEAKRQDLARAGLPWAEVAGTPALLSWGLPAPLPTERSAPAAPLRCANCALRRPTRAAPAAPGHWQQVLRDFRAVQQAFGAGARALEAASCGVLAARPVDRYLPSAARVERDVLFIARAHQSPATVVVGQVAPPRLLYQCPDDGALQQPELEAWAEAYLQRLRRVWVVDAPAGWLYLPKMLADPTWRAAWVARGAPHRARELRRLLGEPSGAAAASADLLGYLHGDVWQGRPHRWVWRAAWGGWVWAARAYSAGSPQITAASPAPLEVP